MVRLVILNVDSRAPLRTAVVSSHALSTVINRPSGLYNLRRSTAQGSSKSSARVWERTSAAVETLHDKAMADAAVAAGADFLN